jgi:hypothetical protein
MTVRADEWIKGTRGSAVRTVGLAGMNLAARKKNV